MHRYSRRTTNDLARLQIWTSFGFSSRVLAEELRSVLLEVVFESSVDRGDDKALYVNLPAMLYKTMHATQHVARKMEAHDSRADDAQAAISEIRQELAELTRDVREMKALVSAAVADRYEQREGRAGGGQGDVGPPLVDALQDLIPRMGRDD
ncbi:unnamed protein product [Vitrella brassicaformis CCMP3155]|uniref:Uncharacterized protein n=1 Tax=Vitrella brassicaformis (strain CCMP3155) TaxID=1169540 RepID=A0A0G4FFF6_VITBC|nr:unnamed protein product [Vitrella brassicaformis CCMP3155]|eukprot:CEM11937.1 unnamed protein product [Vitrella brassicaformis CCMP3155]